GVGRGAGREDRRGRKPLSISELQTLYIGGASPPDPSQTRGEGQRDQQWRLDPALNRTIDDIGKFNRQVDLYLKNFVRDRARPAAFETVSSALSGLYALRLKIEQMGRDLDRLAGKPMDASAHRLLHK